MTGNRRAMHTRHVWLSAIIIFNDTLNTFFRNPRIIDKKKIPVPLMGHDAINLSAITMCVFKDTLNTFFSNPRIIDKKKIPVPLMGHQLDVLRH